MKEKNRVYKLNITAVTPEGDGISRTESGKVVFTPMCCKGDEMTVKIIKETTGYLVGKTEELITPSPDRIQPDCSVFKQCGGCALRHMDYEAEKKLKYDHVRDCLTRIGKCEITPEYIVSPVTERYRNKAQYPVTQVENGLAAGYFARHSHRVIPHGDCLLQPKKTTEIIEDILKELKGVSVYDSTSGKGVLRHLYLRNTGNGEYCVMPVVNTEDVSFLHPVCEKITALHPEIKSFYANINTQNTNVILGKKCLLLKGEPYLTDILCEKRFLVSPLSFWQVNTKAAELLLYKAKEYAALKKGDIVCDLYCGTGTVGICCSDTDTRLFGIEIIPEAVEDASRNAKANGYTDFRFVCADSEKGIEECKKTLGTPRVVLTDPPRKGMTEKVINDICLSGAEKVVYISCNPATLARDVKIFEEKGFKAQKAAVFDLFPRTSHVESVVCLCRQ